MPIFAPVEAPSATQNPLEKISYREAPEWVRTRAFPTEVARHKGEPITRLLVDEQYDAESLSTYRHTADRLENMQAVQNLSQWQLNFDPNIQSVCLHRLKVHRGDETTEYAEPGKARILQREQDLESFVIHGSVTLLVLLEDIRPGDILECRFTITSRPKLLSDRFTCLKIAPTAHHIGDHYISVRHASGHRLHWKTGIADNSPQVTTANGISEILWEQHNVAPTLPEPEMPAWVLPPDWIQVTDIESWADIANAVVASWPVPHDSNPIESAIHSICDGLEDPEAKIENIIRYVQDDFRYLSVNAEVGGQIPASPEIVISRRYGDCKDLSLLLVTLLEQVGVSTNPILVHHELGKILPDMLPCPALFNHVIVEYEYEGKSYWVDPTIKQQGGGIRGRATPDYYYGLRLKPGEKELIPQPEERDSTDSYQLHDTLMLDSAGNHNLLRIQTLARGRFADTFRRQLDNEGPEGFEEASQQHNEQRYNLDKSVEPIRYEDDRGKNVWRMVELYKIPSLKNMNGNSYEISLPSNLVETAIALPEEKTRRFPFAIPNKLNLTHIQEVRSKANTRQSPFRRSFKAHGVSYKVKTEFNRRIWKHTTSLQTTTDQVPAEQVGSLRKMMEGMLKVSGFSMTLPRGHVRLHREPNFFALPEVKEPADPQTTTSKPTPEPSQRQQRIAAHRKGTGRRSRRSSRPKSNSAYHRTAHREQYSDFENIRTIRIAIGLIVFIVLTVLKILLSQS